MASINRATKIKTYTHEGAPAASSVTLKQQLERSVLSCLLWEDTFYESGVDIAERIKDLCNKNKVEDVIDVAREAKQAMRLRHVPLLLLRELCRKPEGLKQMASLLHEFCTRPDDMTEFLSIYWKDGKTPIAAQVKRGLAKAFTKFDAYQISKYKNRGDIKLRDIVCLCRPKPKNEEDAKLYKQLLEKNIAAADTWETEISAKGNNAESWKRLIEEEKLGGMATLRNLRNMLKANLDDKIVKKAITNINAGKLLPINFIAAAPHAPRFESLLEKKFFECFVKKGTKVAGRTIVLVDVSGSMDTGKISAKSELRCIDVACSLAMIAREMFKDVTVLTFSDNLVECPDRRGFALRDAVIKSQRHSGTQLGSAVTETCNNYTFDRLIVITDEQSSDPVTRGLKNGYMINVGSYKHGVGYGNWIHIDGWSDKVLDYIVAYENVCTEKPKKKKTNSRD